MLIKPDSLPEILENHRLWLNNDGDWEELSTREVANWRRLVKKWEEREE